MASVGEDIWPRATIYIPKNFITLKMNCFILNFDFFFYGERLNHSVSGTSLLPLGGIGSWSRQWRQPRQARRIMEENQLWPLATSNPLADVGCVWGCNICRGETSLPLIEQKAYFCQRCGNPTQIRMKGKVSFHLPPSRLYCYASSRKQASGGYHINFIIIIRKPGPQRYFNFYSNFTKLCRG